ncbi:hypothetical protein BpHYR1_020358 [Brachionus plicatilis]|uniref:Uncharacterized protein n=1 Tax=Brachionus plicatilis TaxID=10195 RepID=A0A3M7R6B8_BRAPC|nr:hypothetical protein BpHYR1_020358 [Brachionus plicatilis]
MLLANDVLKKSIFPDLLEYLKKLSHLFHCQLTLMTQKKESKLDYIQCFLDAGGSSQKLYALDPLMYELTSCIFLFIRDWENKYDPNADMTLLKFDNILMSIYSISKIQLFYTLGRRFGNIYCNNPINRLVTTDHSELYNNLITSHLSEAVVKEEIMLRKSYSDESFTKINCSIFLNQFEKNKDFMDEIIMKAFLIILKLCCIIYIKLIHSKHIKVTCIKHAHHCKHIEVCESLKNYIKTDDN